MKKKKNEHKIVALCSVLGRIQKTSDWTKSEQLDDGAKMERTKLYTRME